MICVMNSLRVLRKGAPAQETDRCHVQSLARAGCNTIGSCSGLTEVRRCGGGGGVGGGRDGGSCELCWTASGGGSEMELDDLMGGGGKLDGRCAAEEQQEQLDELE